ncbi:MAG: DNA methylase [Clostridia bacterium]|nr:DNA methylase [Clostridia bacterium]
MQEEHIYAAIDLKSFYASVECRERGLDPLTTNLVVADKSRTEKTICLAVSPSLKAYGIPGRARLFEVVQKVKEVNALRKVVANGKKFNGKSYNDIELKQNPNLELDYIVATPRMGHYMKYSTDIYNTYLDHIAPEDIFAYSVDEVFCDITHYLKLNHMNPQEFVTMMIQDVFNKTGITATAGIGTNLYLCKIAMDIVAKHAEADKNGVRIASLDEMSYRKLLWDHKPITDFWRVGKGYAKSLQKHGIYTMGEVARASIEDEELLYKLFGVNAELLIDHAWGWEPTTIDAVKKYKPSTNSISSGQVLHCPYNHEKTRLIVKEMTEGLTLDLVRKKLETNQIVLTIGYDTENLTNPEIKNQYNGEITIDRYGRKIPKHSHGTENLDHYTSSTKIITQAAMRLYDRISNDKLFVRRINITANNVLPEETVNKENKYEQVNLFTDYGEAGKNKDYANKKEQAEREIQKAMLNIKMKYGKNAVIKGMNLQEGGTAIDRNKQIGGHRE